ncbi:MAG TPA: HAD family hydrolase [Terriglobales bacterium]|nr:HAD family hydrolase [Terriglobales bacterium]
MRFRAIASDYDGTLAQDGHVDRDTLAGLEQARESGRKLILVTGRELPSLRSVFSGFHLFNWIVAENGALIHNPVTREERLLCPAVSGELVANLRQRGVPLSVGKCIVATVRPHDAAVLLAIRRLNLNLHVIFNKESVMVLPRGTNKSTGLSAALFDLGLSSQNVVGIGDAENDHDLLSLCGYSAAVANAIPALKQRADIVTSGSYGAGVVEVIHRLVDEDRLC